MRTNNSTSMKSYIASEDRYDNMQYRRCGNSGILLPVLSLGLWHNFGYSDNFDNARNLLRTAFDQGICHFDLANNYGPPYGSAEESFGRILNLDLANYRDELLISTKAGWDMWPGPYGDLGSKKYLIASLDQSLKRMGLDYVDIFYSHRRDTHTPLEETMGALHQCVQQGKALYVGISQYSAEDTERAHAILKDLGTPLLIHQPRYNMFDRWAEDGLLDVLGDKGIGSIAFSPLHQGVLTNKYLEGFPKDSRAIKDGRYLKKEEITSDILGKVKKLNAIAETRGQNLAQMALAWLLKDERVSTVLIGVSKTQQILDNVKALENLAFSTNELDEIKEILK